MNDCRPELRDGLSVEDFRRFYWRKDELAPFCRKTGISFSGSKAEIVGRVESYLTTGTIDDRNARMASRKSGTATRRGELAPPALDAPIPPGYTSSQACRAFFRSVIGPQFHFTVRFMKFCRENPGKTYRDAVDEWYAEREERKNGRKETRITLACEYNRFVRDYLAANRGKTLKDAADAWNDQKKLPRELRQ